MTLTVTVGLSILSHKPFKKKEAPVEKETIHILEKSKSHSSSHSEHSKVRKKHEESTYTYITTIRLLL